MYVGGSVEVEAIGIVYLIEVLPVRTSKHLAGMTVIALLVIFCEMTVWYSMVLSEVGK